ncbi:MAG TPA: FGGY family carbohydrate kinase [Nakamurella sp.]|nr:FGGY family carbohydrate kinase [Nakamurella sp.]
MHHDPGAGRGTAGPEVVLGVDIGTTSSKGVLVSVDGLVLGTAVREHRVLRPAVGQVEMSASTWWDEFCAISRELLAGVPAAVVVAVGVSGMGPCVLLTGEDGDPVRPAILYGVDMRATAQIAELTDRYTEQAIRARGGSALSTQAVGPKLAWVAQHEPEVFARARRLFMPSSYLVYRLTGEYVLDHHSASQSDPLYDMASGSWYQPWWSDLAGAIAPPPLRWPGDVAGTVTDQAAQLTGLPPGTPVVTGTVDAWAEALSAGAHRVGDLMLMYGTTMFLVDTVARMVTAPTLWSTVGVEPGTHCLAGGMATSGAITFWLDGVFGRPGFEALLAEAQQSPPGSNGLLLLPYFAGERTPIADPDARGVVAGLTLSHTRGDLYRAALEGTAFGVRHNIEAILAAGGSVQRVVAVGGGTKGGLWAQIVSDVTGLPQQLPRHTVGASYGMAQLAARSQGPVTIDDWNPIEHTVQPDPAVRDLFDARYADYLSLYPATSDIVHHLAAQQRRDGSA